MYPPESPEAPEDPAALVRSRAADQNARRAAFWRVMRHSILSVITVLILSFSPTAFCCHAEDAPGARINNSALIPKVVPDGEVRLEGISPDWVKSLIMAELRIETATPEGTFASAGKVLDHYAEMGVNGLWICPVWERGSKGNGYGNFGPVRLEPLLTGTADLRESREVARRFVEEAHRRNIRVIFDIVVWGTRKDAPLVREHPEFYKRLPDGKFWEVWGGYGFDWSHEGFRKWHRDAAVDFLMATGADGYRVDLAPDTSGFAFREVREEMQRRGRKILLVSEMPGERRETFDFEQNGVTGWTEEPDYGNPENHRRQQERFGSHSGALLRGNLVEMIQSGKGLGQASLQRAGLGGRYRFYTQNLLNHDDGAPFVRGSRLRFGYTAVFAPLIPMWWIGEEWNNPQQLIPGAEGGVMFFNQINWAALEKPENRAFFEDVKRYLRIRRSYPDIFENFPAETRQAGLAAVESTRDGKPNPLQAYARFAEGRALLVIPHAVEESGGAQADLAEGAEFTVRVARESLGLPRKKPVILTNLMSAQPVALEAGKEEEVLRFKTRIPRDHLAVILAEWK